MIINIQDGELPRSEFASCFQFLAFPSWWMLRDSWGYLATQPKI